MNGTTKVRLLLIILTTLVSINYQCVKLVVRDETEDMIDNIPTNDKESAAPEELDVDEADIYAYSQVISGGKKIALIKQEAIDSKKPKPINEDQAMALYIGDMR